MPVCLPCLAVEMQCTRTSCHYSAVVGRVEGNVGACKRCRVSTPARARRWAVRSAMVVQREPRSENSSMKRASHNMASYCCARAAVPSCDCLGVMACGRHLARKRRSSTIAMPRCCHYLPPLQQWAARAAPRRRHRLRCNCSVRSVQPIREDGPAMQHAAKGGPSETNVP